MSVVINNIRLKELYIVAQMNQDFYNEFLFFIKEFGYSHLYDFVRTRDDEILSKVLTTYFSREKHFNSRIYDGLGRPYNLNKSKWFFIAWVLRDAPQQRLAPLIKYIEGKNREEKLVNLTITLIKYASSIFQDYGYWEWDVISTVFMERLEGSRRALKGNFIESIIRKELQTIINEKKLDLTISPGQTSLFGETYDIEIKGKNGVILSPVKSRETMGGGHSLLFTRDILEAINLANKNGYYCLPIIIAEQWNDKFGEASQNNFIYIEKNPNQILDELALLRSKLKGFLPLFEIII